MAKYAIYLTGSGTASARPVVGILEIPDEPASTFTARLAAQTALLAVGEAVVQLVEGTSITDEIGTDDTNTISYTVDARGAPNAPPPVSLTPVTVARRTLEQRQAIYRARRDDLLNVALPYANFGRSFTDTEFNNWLTYVKDLRDLSDTPANPEGVVFPTRPSLTGTAGEAVWTRLYRRNNILSTVGLASGVPTGGLIETGSNVNGLYMRFADGGQLCRARIVPGYFSAARLVTSWTFPAAFFGLATYSFHATFSTRDNTNTVAGLPELDIEECTIISQNRSATSIDIHVMSPTYTFVTGDDVWLDLIAFGRWAT